MTALRLLSAGPGVTIQDGGRHGSLRFGVTVAGPMDPVAFALAHRAIGNPAGAGAIEISLGGLEATVDDGSLDVAVIAPRATPSSPKATPATKPSSLNVPLP